MCPTPPDGDDSGGTGSPKACLERYDLILEVTTQYDPTLNEENGLVVGLDEPMGTHGSLEGES